MVRLEFAEEGDFYKVVTAGPLRKTQYAKKQPLWEGAHSTLSPEGNPLAARRALQRGQSGVEENIPSDNPEGNTFFQLAYHKADAAAKARGAIVFRPEDGQALIALFKGKRDMSTRPLLQHEGGLWVGLSAG